MVIQLSPGVQVTETDLTNIVPANSATVGAFVGAYVWGPVEKMTLIESENRLASIFGNPDANTYQHFMTAANYLAYSDNLQNVRVVGSRSWNAYGGAGAITGEEMSSSSSSSNSDSSSSGDEILIKNIDHYETQTIANIGDAVFVAKYPGLLGNSLHVSLCDDASAFAAGWNSQISGTSYDQDTLFDAAPNTSDYVTERGGSLDELHIVVRDKDGLWTGTQGEVLEIFPFLSKALGAKNADGSSNYWVDVLKNQSKYLWAGTKDVVGTTNWGSDSSTTFDSATTVDWELAQGEEDNAPTDGELQTGWDLFTDTESVSVSLLITGPASTTLAAYVIDIAVSRKDCVAFISPESADVVDNIGNSTQQYTDVLAFEVSVAKDTSYAFCDSGWKYQYDKYNDVFRWVPLNGDMAGLAARTDATNDPWWSFAGYNRGQIKNAVKLAFNPTQTQRDGLYKAGINSVVSFPGQGIILYGDKTLQSKPSAFQSVNVRRLFIIIEQQIAEFSKYSLFELNDEFTRNRFKSSVDGYLRDILGRRGVTDFRVVCDSTNNTAGVIDRQEFIADIFVKPTRSINFIKLNFIATRSGVSFNEIGG